jgi:Serine carboxypeptidase S28
MKIAVKFCLVCLLGSVQSFNRLSSLYNTHEEPSIELDDYKSTIKFTVKEKWIEQKLDHFNESDSRVWMMRFLENDRFFQPGEVESLWCWQTVKSFSSQDGPIFIYIGGEWEITAGWISAGHMFDMAKEFNGTMFYTEHRFYGKSRPTVDTSTENLRFLTVEQALADLAHFIEHWKASCLLKDSGVFVVGASYSASLATWARIKFPHLIDGAWAKALL